MSSWWEEADDMWHNTVNQVKRLSPSVACEDSSETDTQTETWENVRGRDNKQSKIYEIYSKMSC